MKIKLDCVPCYVNQALEASEYAKMDMEERWETVLEVCRELSEVDRRRPSAQIGQMVHRIVREHADMADPYLQQKQESNEQALEFYGEFESAVAREADSLKAAARLAAAGNAVDFGPSREFDVESELRRGLEEEFAIDHWSEFIQKLRGADKILYFSDNSGEIIYDKLFIERLLELPHLNRLDLVVKDGPFLNDVTKDDAEALHLNEIKGVRIRQIDNGDGGKLPTLWSSEVESWIDSYDLVVSKGQANYEGLSEYGKESLFFLLVVKCGLVEAEVGAAEGDKVLLNSKKHLDKHGN